MEKRNDHTQQKDADQKPNDSESFLIQELIKRAEIQQNLSAYKNNVDCEKNQKLQQIDSERQQREQDVSSNISALEEALNGNDAEAVKAALKNMKI